MAARRGSGPTPGKSAGQSFEVEEYSSVPREKELDMARLWRQPVTYS